MIQLHNMSVADLNQLETDITQERSRRDRISTAQAFIDERNNELATIAAEYGVIPFGSRDKHLPGQHVEHEGVEYVNVSGMVTSLPPGEPLTVWEAVTPDEPDEPDEPTDHEPTNPAD